MISHFAQINFVKKNNREKNTSYIRMEEFLFLQYCIVERKYQCIISTDVSSEMLYYEVATAISS